MGPFQESLSGSSHWTRRRSEWGEEMRKRRGFPDGAADCVQN